VQRLYLKYFRAESFRKALRYQKRYLSIRVNELEEHNNENNNNSLTSVIPHGNNLSAKSRFKVAAWSVIAINRMKYLVRKYQRYLLKSSPTYNYKEKQQRGSSTVVRNQTQLPLPSNALLEEERRQLYPAATLSAKQHQYRHSSGNSEISTDDMLPLQAVSNGNNKSLTNQHETVLSNAEYPYTRHSIRQDTKPMILQDLFSSPPEGVEQTYRVGATTTNSSHNRQQKTYVNTPIRESPGERKSYGKNQRGSLERDNPHVTGRDYRNSGRGFDSLRGLDTSSRLQQPPQVHQKNSTTTSPPISYPRPKSNVLHDQDFIPTKLENSSRARATKNAADHSRDTSRFSSTVLDGMGSSDNAQEELKGYMKKLEDLQRRLKSQATESKRSRNSRKPPDDEEF